MDPITPNRPPSDKPKDSDELRDMSLVTTMDIFTELKDARTPSEDEKILWTHLEGRLKYLLNIAGLR